MFIYTNRYVFNSFRNLNHINGQELEDSDYNRSENNMEQEQQDDEEQQHNQQTQSQQQQQSQGRQARGGSRSGTRSSVRPPNYSGTSSPMKPTDFPLRQSFVINRA